MAKHSMYDETPSIAHDEEGNSKVKKAEKKKEVPKEKTEMASSGLPSHVRHAHERRDMHNRHEVEHAMHDNGKGGDKKEMHARHKKEMMDMHSRHEKDAGATGGSTVGDPIKDIEKGAK